MKRLKGNYEKVIAGSITGQKNEYSGRIAFCIRIRVALMNHEVNVSKNQCNFQAAPFQSVDP